MKNMPVLKKIQPAKPPVPRILISDAITWELPELPMKIERYSARENLPKELHDADALVVWNVGQRWLSFNLPNLLQLRWIQALSAGIDHVLNAKPHNRIVVTNGKGLHDAPTAEMAVALLLAATRNIHLHRDNQTRVHWDKTAYMKSLNHTGLATLEGARILIIGMGAIGLEIARRLQPFGANIEGVATNAGVRDGFHTHSFNDLDALLPKYDAIVLALPDTPRTKGLISRHRIALLAPHAWLINVGRGSAIDEDALMVALEKNKIAGAGLDVMSKEPLVEESKLWLLPNVILTPHVAGGGPRFYSKANTLLERNAKHFVSGEELENVVSREHGY